MSYQIERLSFGGIFDQSFKLMKDHFVPLCTGFAALYVPYYALTAMLKVDDPTNVSFAKVGFLGVVFLIFLVLMPLFQIAATMLIADAYQSQPTSFKSALSRSTKLYWPYLGTSMLTGLAIMGWSMLLVLPGIYFMICYSLIGPIAVVEGLFGRKAMQRSRDLVRGYWSHTFGVMFVASLVAGLAGGVFQMVFAFIPFLGAVLTGLVQAVVGTYAAAVIVVLYVDLRCRHEDFDLQLLAREVAGDRSGRPSGAGAAQGGNVAPV